MTLLTLEANLAAELEEEFFGPDFFEQEAVVDKILACYTVEDYQAIAADRTPEMMAKIFASAAFTDPDAKTLTADELTRIFNELPAVRNTSDFL